MESYYSPRSFEEMSTRPVNSFLVLKSLEWGMDKKALLKNFPRQPLIPRSCSMLTQEGRRKSLSLPVSVTEGSATCAMRDMQGTQWSHCRHLSPPTGAPSYPSARQLRGFWGTPTGVNLCLYLVPVCNLLTAASITVHA